MLESLYTHVDLTPKLARLPFLIGIVEMVDPWRTLW
jgi:hypothetical protein